MILWVLSAFRHTESTPRIDGDVDRALPLLLHVESTYTAQVAAANDAVELASGKVAAMKEELKRLDDLKQQLQGGTSSRD